MDKIRELTFIAAEADAGRTVRDILKTRFGLVAHDISRAKYRLDGIRVNGIRTYVTTILKAGDELTARIGDEPVKPVVLSDEPIDILYEDDDLIAVNKPAGVVVHPSHGHYSDSLGNAVAGYFNRKGEAHDIRTIGRLDKETSGVILYAKTRSAVYLMAKQAEEGLFAKTYLALVEGHLEEPSGTFTGPIGRVPGVKMKREVRPDGDCAVTHYEVLREYEIPDADLRDEKRPGGEMPGDVRISGNAGGSRRLTLVKVRLETGRTHQIRVHFSDSGHPLAGDRLYGGRPVCLVRNGGCPEESGGEARAVTLTRAALHCCQAVFRKLFSDESITLTASLPEDMAEILAFKQI